MLNNRNSPDRLWTYWRNIVGSLLHVNQYGYITIESHSYFRRRNGLQTVHFLLLPEQIGTQFNMPGFSARDHVDVIYRMPTPVFELRNFTNFVVNPTAVFNYILVEFESAWLKLPTFDRTWILPEEVEYQEDPSIGIPVTPVIPGFIVENAINSLYNERRAASFAASTSVTVISDGTVDNFEYEFDLDTSSSGPRAQRPPVTSSLTINPFIDI